MIRRLNRPELDSALAEPHDVLLLFDEYAVQVLLDNRVEPIVEGLIFGHIAEPVVDALQILELELLLLLHALVLEDLFALLDHALAHPHDLLNVLVLEVDNLLEGLLIEAQEPCVVLLRWWLDCRGETELAWHRRH